MKKLLLAVAVMVSSMTFIAVEAEANVWAAAVLSVSNRKASSVRLRHNRRRLTRRNLLQHQLRPAQVQLLQPNLA